MTTHFSFPPSEVQLELKCIAETLVSPGKGILAADESVTKMGKRFQEFQVQNSEEMRKKWRQLLFLTDGKISEYIAGVILVHETLYQKDEGGKLLVDYLKERCIVPGIKVDTGLVNLYSSENEVITQGIDDLEMRLAKYKTDGCEFAKWRCIFKITANTPSYRALISNADLLARYASICQSQRICPVIEPEVVPEGNHDIERCQKVTETVLSFVYRAMNDHHVFLEGTILKPNMVTAGLTSQSKANASQIAEATVTALRRTVPPAVGGICFSSGGQTEEEATANLSAINKFGGRQPWRLSFAFGRALQMSALRTWGGKSEQTQQAQSAFLKRAQANSEAVKVQPSDRDFDSEFEPQTPDRDSTTSITASPSTPVSRRTRSGSPASASPDRESTISPAVSRSPSRASPSAKSPRRAARRPKSRRAAARTPKPKGLVTPTTKPPSRVTPTSKSPTQTTPTSKSPTQTTPTSKSPRRPKSPARKRARSKSKKPRKSGKRKATTSQVANLSDYDGSASTITTDDVSGTDSLMGLIGSSQLSDLDYQTDVDEESVTEFPKSL